MITAVFLTKLDHFTDLIRSFECLYVCKAKRQHIMCLHASLTTLNAIWTLVYERIKSVYVNELYFLLYILEFLYF